MLALCARLVLCSQELARAFAEHELPTCCWSSLCAPFSNSNLILYYLCRFESCPNIVAWQGSATPLAVWLGAGCLYSRVVWPPILMAKPFCQSTMSWVMRVMSQLFSGQVALQSAESLVVDSGSSCS